MINIKINTKSFDNYDILYIHPKAEQKSAITAALGQAKTLLPNACSLVAIIVAPKIEICTL